MNKPLAGVFVLDLTRLLPGPMASLHLADLGADVLKIEDPGAGDYARVMGAMDGAASYFFKLINRNKRSRVLDLKSADDRAVLLEMVESADILLEGFRPGVMARLGLDYETLAQRNRRLVHPAASPAMDRPAPTPSVPVTTSTTWVTPGCSTRWVWPAVLRRCPTCRSPICWAAH